MISFLRRVLHLEMIKPEDYDTDEEFEEALDDIRASYYELAPHND